MAYKGEPPRLLAQSLFRLPSWLLGLMMVPALLFCPPWRWLLRLGRRRRAARGYSATRPTPPSAGWALLTLVSICLLHGGGGHACSGTGFTSGTLTLLT
ncbi:hypothetical protein MBH78_20355 [Oceanimonas sp. NS1]|nr:hypothetical protein [Oceanimonas sp. NS1]